MGEKRALVYEAMVPLQNSLGEELVLVEDQKNCFSRATENSDWTDSLASCLDLPCRDLRSS